MEYQTYINENQNYFIVYGQFYSDLFVKFTDKNTYISYENTISPKDFDNLPISKFIEIFGNCINSIPNYKIFIELDLYDDLKLNLNYDTDNLNLSYQIILFNRTLYDNKDDFSDYSD